MVGREEAIKSNYADNGFYICYVCKEPKKQMWYSNEMKIWRCRSCQIGDKLPSKED